MHTSALAIAAMAAAVWIGAIVFQSFVVAPTVFGSLDADQARRFLRSVFPRFYRLGLLCGVVLLGGSLVLGMAAGWPPAARWVLAMAVLMVAAVGLSLLLVPRINAARDAGRSGDARFHRLHGVSVGLTVAILVLASITLVLLTTSLAPAG